MSDQRGYIRKLWDAMVNDIYPKPGISCGHCGAVLEPGTKCEACWYRLRMDFGTGRRDVAMGRWKVWSDEFKSSDYPRVCDVEVIAESAEAAQRYWRQRESATRSTGAERLCVDTLVTVYEYGARGLGHEVAIRESAWNKIYRAAMALRAERAPKPGPPPYKLDSFGNMWVRGTDGKDRQISPAYAIELLNAEGPKP